MGTRGDVLIVWQGTSSVLGAAESQLSGKQRTLTSYCVMLYRVPPGPQEF